jgi:hypothetical protein
VKAGLVLVTYALTGALGGCASKPSVDDFTVAEVKAIAVKCGLPIGQLLLNQGWVTMSSPVAGDEAGACTLKELRSAGKKHVTIVGNEIHRAGQGK